MARHGSRRRWRRLTDAQQDQLHQGTGRNARPLLLPASASRRSFGAGFVVSRLCKACHSIRGRLAAGLWLRRRDAPWSPASDNQALIAGEASYILNPISAYRTLQVIDPEAAADIGLAPALAGPAGPLASTHGWLTYIIPKYVQGDELEAAKQFILDHTANYRDAVLNSALYNFPCYPSTVPELDSLLQNDPFGSVPPDKLTVLGRAHEWSIHAGYPGPTNPAVLQFFSENWIANVVASVALGEKTAEDALAEAHERAETIFDEWRAKGLVAGGAGQADG